MFHDIILGFSLILNFTNILGIIGGTFFGVILGAIPGLTGTMGMALIIPLTYTLSPITAFAILMGTFKGCLYGGSIPAILINTPGTPAACVTIFDGYPLAQKGQAGKALGMALWASVIGDGLSTLCLIFFAVSLAQVALKFGPPEYATLIVFSLTIVAGVSGESILKGLIAATLGFLFAIVGLDPITSTPRFTFGMVALFEGINLMVMLIGLFAVSEFLVQTENIHTSRKQFVPKFKGTITLRELIKCLPAILKGTAIGTVLGAIPGLGAVPSAFLSYSEAQRSSKHPEEFGKGAIEGVAAAEAGNNATCGGSMIPLLALGVPGDVTAAVLLGAFLIHGLTLGPTLFTEQTEFVYALFAALLVAIAFLPIVGRISIYFFGLMTRVPQSVLFPVTAILCVVGGYGFNSSQDDLWLMLIFGLIGYVMRKIDYPLAPFLIGFILEPIGEIAIRQSLALSNGSLFIFVTRPIAALFLGLAALATVVIYRVNFKKAKAQRASKGMVCKT